MPARQPGEAFTEVDQELKILQEAELSPDSAYSSLGLSNRRTGAWSLE